MKYYLLSNSAIISIGDKTYTISKDDYRYEKIKDKLINNDFATVEKLVSPTENLNKTGFVVEDGLVLYNGQAIPSVLGNQFVKYQQSSWEFKSLFNFWCNLKTRTTTDEASDVIGELINKNAYAVTEDGFYFVYCDRTVDQTQNKLNKKNNNRIFNFYNIASCPTNYFELFSQRNNIKDIIEKVFGFCSKNLKNLILKNIFNEHDNFINYKFFFYGEALKDVLTSDNLLLAIKENLIDVNCGDIGGYKDLNVFLKDYSIDKNGKYSQKKIINFLNSAADKNHLIEVGIFYVQLKNALNLNLQEIELSSNCEKIHEYFSKEMEKIKNPLFYLDNDLHIQNLQDCEFGDFRILIPNTNYDLMEWSNIMGNCIGKGNVYSNQVKNKQSHLIAIMDKDTNLMLYNIQISNNHIIQFLGKHNSSPNPEHKKIVSKFLQENNVIFKE